MTKGFSNRQNCRADTLAESESEVNRPAAGCKLTNCEGFHLTPSLRNCKCPELIQVRVHRKATDPPADANANQSRKDGSTMG